MLNKLVVSPPEGLAWCISSLICAAIEAFRQSTHAYHITLNSYVVPTKAADEALRDVGLDGIGTSTILARVAATRHVALSGECQRISVVEETGRTVLALGSVFDTRRNVLACDRKDAK